MQWQVPKGLAAEDQRIAERLERLHKVNLENADMCSTRKGQWDVQHRVQCKLRCFNILQERKEKNQLPSEDEVRARLDRLKGVPHSEKGTQQQQAQFYRPPDTRTSTEQVNHLVTATSAKVVITDACISEGIHGCWFRSTLRHVMSYSVLKRTLLDALPG